jgi:hypothetical protein
MDFLFSISLLLVTGGIVLSVYEEWEKVGLTDTSYSTLCLWVAGLLGISFWGWLKLDVLIALTALAPVGLFVYWIYLKIMTFLKTKIRWSQLERMIKNQRY